MKRNQKNPKNSATPAVTNGTASNNNGAAFPANTSVPVGVSIKPGREGDVRHIYLMAGKKILSVAKVFGGIICFNGKPLPGDCEMEDFPSFKKLMKGIIHDTQGLGVQGASVLFL